MNGKEWNATMVIVADDLADSDRLGEFNHWLFDNTSQNAKIDKMQILRFT